MIFSLLLSHSFLGLAFWRWQPSSTTRDGRLVQSPQNALQREPWLLYRRPLCCRTRTVSALMMSPCVQSWLLLTMRLYMADSLVLSLQSSCAGCSGADWIGTEVWRRCRIDQKVRHKISIPQVPHGLYSCSSPSRDEGFVLYVLQNFMTF